MAAPSDPLDDDHREVARLVMRGLPLEEIDRQLGLAPGAAQAMWFDSAQALMAPASASAYGAADEVPANFTTRDGLEVSLQVVPARSALATWRRLIRDAPKSGSWPLIVSQRPQEDGLRRLIEDASESDCLSSTEFIDLAASIDARQLLDKMWQEAFQYDEEARAELLASVGASSRTAPLIKSELVPRSGTAVIGVFPCADSYVIPAVLGYGGWNGSPEPQQHVAVLQHWQERFQARLLAISTDTIELHVGRPPATLEEATELATHHVGYCAEDLGRSIHELAGALMTSDHWHFWWD